MRQLSLPDLAIVVLYVLGTTLLGAWFSRRQRDLKTYFVGGRNVPWWLVLASIVATETSTVTFLSVPGLAFAKGGNLTFLQLSFGYILGRALVAWLLLPQYLKGELFTAYQLLRQRFSPSVQRTASALFLVTRTVADGLRLYLTALLLNVFLGWSVPASIVVMTAVTLVYTYLGGMEAVIWTDLVQLVIYLLGAALAAAFLLDRIPGGLETYLDVGRQAGKFRLLDLSTDPRQTFTFWTGLVGGACFTMASHGADQLMVQRYLCSRSLTQARVALVASGVVVLLQFLLFLLLGVGLYVFYRPDLAGGEFINDRVFGRFIVEQLPTGLVGLVIAAVLAAAMSTLSSSLNSSASAFVNDLYRPLRPDASEQHYLGFSKLMTTVWGVAQMTVALAAVGLGGGLSVVERVLAVAGFTTGMVLGLFLLGSLGRPVRSSAALVGLVAGFVAVTAVWLPSTLGHPLLAWPWYAPVGTLTTVAVGLGVDLLLGVKDAVGSPDDGGPQPGLGQPR